MEFEFEWRSSAQSREHLDCRCLADDGTCVAVQYDIPKAILTPELQDRIERELEAEGLAYIEDEGLSDDSDEPTNEAYRYGMRDFEAPEDGSND